MNSDTMSHAESDQLDCQEVSDLLSAYSLEILDPLERAAVARHLASCPDCRRRLEQDEAVVALLGHAVPPAAPPPSLRARLLDEINAAPVAQVPVPAPAPPIPFRRPRSGIVVSRWAAVGMALVASLLLIGLVASSVLLYQARDARDKAQSAQTELAEYLRQGGAVVALAPVGGGGGNGSLIVEQSGQQGMLVVGDLAPTGADHTYKVWAARGNERWAVGELAVSANGSGWKEIQCPEPLTWYDTVGVTLVGSNGEKQDLLTASVPQAQR